MTMGNSLASIGWAIQVTRAPHLDYETPNANGASETWNVFVVNLVRPGATSEPGADWRFVEPGPEITVAEAIGVHDGLLCPWRWTEIEWQAYSVEASGALVPIASQVVPSGTPQPDERQREEVREHLRVQIKDGGAECDRAFSASPDLQEAPRRSLVHSLAPLTHYPAGLAEKIFQMTGLIAVMEGSWEAGVWCFPRFSSAGDGAPAERWEPQAPSWSSNPPKPDTDVRSHMTSGSAADPKVSFLCHFEAWEPQPATSASAATPPSSRKSTREPARSAALQHLALQLTPVCVYAQAADTQPSELEKLLSGGEPVRETLLAAIRDSWGTGWGRVRGEQPPNRGSHIFEYLLDEGAFESIRGPLEAVRDGWHNSDARELIKGFSAYLVDSAADTARNDGRLLERREAEALAHALREISREGSWESRAVVGALREIANASCSFDSSARHLGDWLRYLYKERPVSVAWLQSLANARYSVDQVIHSRLGAIEASVTVPRELWNALDKIVLEGGSEKQGLIEVLQGLVAGAPGVDWRRPIEALVEGLVGSVRTAEAEEVSTGRDRGLRLSLEESGESVLLGAKEVDRRIRGYAVGLESGLLLGGSGQRVEWDSGRAAWLTNVALRVADHNGYLVEDNQGQPGRQAILALTETVGSVLRDGMRTVEIEYSGKPLVADDSESRSGGSPLLRYGYGWPSGDGPGGGSWPLPLLGYGQRYRAIVPPIDNAGGVCSDWARSASAVLKSAHDAIEAAGTAAQEYPYLSSEPPGAPRVFTEKESERALRDTLRDERDDLSRESLAHAFLLGAAAQAAPSSQEPSASSDHARLPYVALLGTNGGGLFDQRWSTPLKVSFEPPATHSDFLRRWLLTDLLVLEKKAAIQDSFEALMSDPELQRTDVAALQEFLENAAPEVSDTRSAKATYHPAVSALGVAVDFWEPVGTSGTSRRAILPAVPLKRLEAVTDADGQQKIRLVENRRIPLEVKALDEGPSTLAWDAANGLVGVGLAPGSFARVMVFSLVEESFFASKNPASGTSRQRYRQIVGQRGPEEIEQADIPWTDARPSFRASDSELKLEYRGFGPVECWFEAAPAFSQEQVKVDLTLSAPGAEDSGNPNEAVLACKSVDGPDAPWVSGVSVERHEWHWTGYPVRLPSESEEFEKWLASFAGVASYRETIDHRFRMLLGGGAALRISGPTEGGDSGGEVVHRLRLPAGSRPARYTAYVARPTVRFRRMLAAAAGPLRLEDLRIAIGTVLRGVAPSPSELRLQPPPLRWTAPLTTSYEGGDGGEDGARPKRGINASLLVFDEPLRRTDELARIGGLGECYEIDLVWSGFLEDGDDPERKRWVPFPEIGPNPVFHPAPEGPESGSCPEQGLLVGEPFGLTYDLIRNAGVAQTAVVVRPKANPEGQWMLAKIRARRVLLPETLLDSNLRRLDATAGNATPSSPKWELPVRRVGTEQVPIDFAIDCLDGVVPKGIVLALGAGSSPTHTLKTPEAPECLGHPTDSSADPKRRLLCSWHKGRWQGGGDATWRAQVLLQEKPDAKLLEWRTAGRVHPFEQPDLPSLGESAELSIKLPGHTGALAASAVHVSDYTDPEWVHIIGSFGRECLGRPDQYLLEYDATAENSLSMRGDGAALPVLPGKGANDKPVPLQQAVLFVYKPIDSVVRGDSDETSGAMLAAYRVDACDDREVRFERMKWHNGNTSEDRVAPDSSCFGYLLSFQKTNPPAEVGEEMKWPDTVESLFEAIFGSPGVTPPNESTIRPLPQYLGPMRLVRSA